MGWVVGLGEGGVPIIKHNKFGVKFEDVFVSVTLEIGTCLGTLLLLSITSQLTGSVDDLMPSTFVLLWSQTKCSYGGWCSVLELSLL